MTRLMIVLPLGLAALAAGPAVADDLREELRAGVAQRTEARIAARETMPASRAAETRSDAIHARLDRRAEAGAPRLRPDIRLVRRGTRIDARLAD